MAKRLYDDILWVCPSNIHIGFVCARGRGSVGTEFVQLVLYRWKALRPRDFVLVNIDSNDHSSCVFRIGREQERLTVLNDGRTVPSPGQFDAADLRIGPGNRNLTLQRDAHSIFASKSVPRYGTGLLSVGCRSRAKQGKKGKQRK